MYTIIMNDDKQLVATNTFPIYQGENLADTIRFILPKTYDNYDLTEFTVSIQYVDTEKNNVSRSSVMARNGLFESDTKIAFDLNIDHNFTKDAGEKVLQLEISKLDDELGEEIIIKSSTISITISEAINEEAEENPEVDSGENGEGNQGSGKKRTTR